MGLKKEIRKEINRLYGPSGYEGLDNWTSVRNTNIFGHENSQDLYEGLQASRGLDLYVDKTIEDNINHIKKEINKGLPIDDENRIKELERFNVLKKVDRVYELGFRMPKLLKYYEGTGKKATGLDVVKVNVLIGKYLNYDCVIHDLTSEEPLDFEENSLIIAYHSFEHLPNPSKAIKKVYDGMKKSCFFHIEVPTENINYIIDEQGRLTPHIRVGHCHAFHTGELKRIIENLEFEIINFTPLPPLSFPSQSVLCRLK